jgi:hypothetical protein
MTMYWFRMIWLFRSSDVGLWHRLPEIFVVFAPSKATVPVLSAQDDGAMWPAFDMMQRSARQD